MSRLAPLAVTMGDPAGIGGEITLLAWQRRHDAIPPFLMLDDPDRLAALAAGLGWSVPVREITAPEEAIDLFADALPVLRIPLAEPVVPGKAAPRNGPSVIVAIDRAVELTQAGRCAAVVTNPINKHVLYEAGFRHPGHTEYLAALAGPGIVPVMMLACPELRVVPITVHVSLQTAARSLTSEAIVTAGRITAAALRTDFGIESPVLAVAGLNPHAGESGSIGREEIEIIRPAIETLRAEGLRIDGPAPADSLFHAAARRRFDAALCMYHDQALIPIKTIDFDGGVNVTLGLPFIRTSPDHGTAFDIAGRGIANPTSLMAALRLAGEMAQARARRHSNDA